MSEHIAHECGIFGVWGSPEAARLTYLGLYALQHRGQESAGIVASDGTRLTYHKQMGLVADVFSENTLEPLEGERAVGHVRYSTTGSSLLKNAQPLVVDYKGGSLGLALNGNLTNAPAIRYQLEQEGAIFNTTTDTEVVLHLIARSQQPCLVDRIREALDRIEGAYAMLFVNQGYMVAVRDPHGFRPLSLGEMSANYERPGALLFSSESCAFQIMEGTYVRELEPGEMFVVSPEGTQSILPDCPQSEHACVFELIYFARPDSFVFGRDAYDARLQMGAQLAAEDDVEADVVIPVPDSSNIAALGYAQASGRPFKLGIIRNHYVGRTFIEPQQRIRDFGARVKYSPVRTVLEGQRVIVVDDSLVRGTTCRKIVKMLRQAGAREVHLRLASPPLVSPCFYGIDIPSRQELIAATHTLDEIATQLRVDSLRYLSLEGLHKACGTQCQFCTACFTGHYPTDLSSGDEAKFAMEKVMSREL